MSEAKGDDLLTIDQVAEILKCSTKTVTRCKIPTVTVGRRLRRYRREAVEQYIRQRADKPSENSNPRSRRARQRRQNLLVRARVHSDPRSGRYSWLTTS
jgi:excisionase family DNA binding protein